MSGLTKENKVNETKNQSNTKKNISVESNSKKLIRLYFIGKNDMQNFCKNQVISNVLDNNKVIKMNTGKVQFLNKPSEAIDQLKYVPKKEHVLDKKKDPPPNKSNDLAKIKKTEKGSFVNIFFKLIYLDHYRTP